MWTRAGHNMSDDFQGVDVDDGGAVARSIRAFIVDPQIFLVMLQSDSGWLRSGIDLSQHLPARYINHRNLARQRRRDEQSFLVAGHYPVFAGTRQLNQCQKLAAPETGKRIYDGNVRLVI